MAFQPPGNPAQPAFREYDPEKVARQHRLKVLALSLVALAAFIAFQAALLSRWVAVDTRPPAWDQSIHLETALDYRDGGDKLHPVPKPGMPPFPPLYHFALGRAVGRPDADHAALWVNFGYFIALTLCLFGLIFEFRGDWAAAAAAVAFMCAPGVQELLYSQLVDLPVLACSTAAYWAFIRSDEFTNWLPSLAFAVLFAVGMLHKWSFFAYMIPAYIAWLRAAGRKGPKGPMLAAAALAALLSAPWYAMNWPLLLPRLFQASADFAVPVWHGGAALVYLLASVSGLGVALWFMGWIGLIVPKYQRREGDGWLISLWVISSYVFWAIVPNRQMRFLMPGLPGLAVLAVGSWPSALIALMLGLQLLGAANYARGWIGAISLPTPIGSVGLFEQNAPRRENWHIDDILADAEKRRDPSEPVADLVLIANHQSFNAPTFSWRRRALRLEHVRVRGVNKRLSEFAQFVLLKRGDLGPAAVIGDLPKAAEIVASPKSWFARGYEKAASWPLPDGSEAELYQRRKFASPPFRARGPVSFQFYTKGPLAAEGLVVDLGKFDAAAGVYPLAKIGAREAEVRGLRMTRLAVELEGLLAIPAVDMGDTSPDEFDEIRFLKLRTLRVVSVDLTVDAVRSFLEARIKGLHIDSLELDGTLKLSGRLRSFGLSLELAPELQASPRALRLRLVSLKVGPNPVPVAAINRIKELTISLEPNPETPFAIELPGLTLKGGRLTVP